MNPSISAYDTETALVKFLDMEEKDCLEIPAYVLNPLLRVLETLKRPCTATMFFNEQKAFYMVASKNLAQ